MLLVVQLIVTCFKTFVTSKSARIEQNFGHKYAVPQVDQLLLRRKLHVQIEHKKAKCLATGLVTPSVVQVS